MDDCTIEHYQSNALTVLRYTPAIHHKCSNDIVAAVYPADIGIHENERYSKSRAETAVRRATPIFNVILAVYNAAGRKGFERGDAARKRIIKEAIGLHV